MTVAEYNDILTLVGKVDALAVAIAEMQADIASAKNGIVNIESQVKPVLETLTQNSMFKMMFGGKK